MLPINVNPKDYLKKYRNKDVNKYHKCMRKETLGMIFDLFSSRILSLNNHEHLKKKKNDPKNYHKTDYKLCAVK